MTAITPRKPLDSQFSISLPRFLRDVRVLAAIGQLIFVFLFTGLVSYIAVNVYNSLVAQNMTPQFAFMQQRAGFQISESPAWYTSDRTFQDAYIVGILNTLRVVIPGLFTATLIGVLLGIALLSRNFMVRTTSASYVEVLRNTPLLVQLIFWYFVVMFSLPVQDITLPNESVFVLQLRMAAYPLLWIGLGVLAWQRRLPRHALTGALLGFLLLEVTLRVIGSAPTTVMALGAVGAVLAASEWTGRLPTWARGYALGIGASLATQGVGALAVEALVGLGALSANALVWDIYPGVIIARRGFGFPEIRLEDGLQVILPQKPRLQFTAGTVVTPEYMALFIGLVIYTSAFIGEIVRAGIQAVPYGQLEASRALGLSGWQMLRLVVLPQALRVILPPLSSQYLNLAKNSTLATAIAYADAYSVGQTIMNTSGQSVPGFIIILITYLTMSLIIATIMNIVNSRFQLVTR
jgi:general L-amino acid transport system permease protein